MQIYLVGGAVRDQLLGLPVRERDWVVVGASPADLLDLGFRQVGADFPVFLHPESGEEYALARTERKQGQGYHGFVVDYDSGVTLEQDLQRRDLTINAIAQDEQGDLIDPYGGQADLAAKVLRHISASFSEDPLRVLRVARFAARFAGHGFTVAPETLELMRQMVRDGEVDHLVPERVWKEIQRSLVADRPSEFVRILRACGALQVLLPEVEALFGVPQPAAYHPEIDTGEHLLLVLDQAQQLAAGDAKVVFAALLHDLGKALTPQAELPSHRKHEMRGVPLIQEVCGRLRVPNEYRDLALKVGRYHLDCHRALELRPMTVLRLFERLDVLRKPELLAAFLLVCEADKRGRAGLQDEPYPQAAYLGAALKAALSVQAADVLRPGLSGPAVGEALRKARAKSIAELRAAWPLSS